MKKKTLILATVALVTSVSPLLAEATTSACPAQGRQCVVRDGDRYCSWTENVISEKLIWGRAGQPAFTPVLTSQTKLEKCADSGHDHGLL